MPKKTQQKDDGINYKKLFFELMTVLAVIFAVVLAVLFPILREHGAFGGNDEYAAYDDLLASVDYYDTSKGRDLEFEKYLNDNYYEDHTNVVKTFYYGIATATYYCQIGYYNTSEEIFNALYQDVPNGKRPRMDLETRDVICQRKMKEKNE